MQDSSHCRGPDKRNLESPVLSPSLLPITYVIVPIDFDLHIFPEVLEYLSYEEWRKSISWNVYDSIKY